MLIENLIKHSRVAQLVEQVAVNHRVAGSSPASGASTFCYSANYMGNMKWLIELGLAMIV